MTTNYAIRGGEEGKRRLDLLSQIMGPSTEALLTRVGVRAGMECLDLGCGGGHVSGLLARLVGEGGSVVGIDLDEVKLAAARQDCLDRGLHVEFRTGSVSEWTEPATYDVVYGRFILSHLADRPKIVARMIAALRPGGVLVLEDIDFTGAFSYPANDAYQQYCGLYRAVIRRRGGDADLGPQLYSLCVDAGLKDVEVRVVQPTHAGRDPEKMLMLSTLLNIREAVVSEGLASSEEIEATVAGLTHFTDDPRSTVSLPRVFQVWGRRVPAAA